jgi:hypothetical protein
MPEWRWASRTPIRNQGFKKARWGVNATELTVGRGSQGPMKPFGSYLLAVLLVNGNANSTELGHARPRSRSGLFLIHGQSSSGTLVIHKCRDRTSVGLHHEELPTPPACGCRRICKKSSSRVVVPQADWTAERRMSPSRPEAWKASLTGRTRSCPPTTPWRQPLRDSSRLVLAGRGLGRTATESRREGSCRMPPSFGPLRPLRLRQ